MNGQTRLSMPLPAAAPTFLAEDGTATTALPLSAAVRARIQSDSRTAPIVPTTAKSVPRGSATALLAVAKVNAIATDTACTEMARIRSVRKCSADLSLALMNAEWWLRRLGGFLNLLQVELRPPHVSTNATDEVVYEWWSGERKLTVYFTGTTAEFVTSWGADVEHDMDDGAFESAMHASRVYRWLLGGER